MILLALASFNTLFLELTLVKLAETLVYQGLAYLIVCLIFFAFALSSLFLLNKRAAPLVNFCHQYYSSLFILFLGLIYFSIKTININTTLDAPLLALLKVTCVLFFLLLPFILNGFIICSKILSAPNLAKYYLVDMLSASAACVFFTFILNYFSLDTCFFILCCLTFAAGLLSSNKTKRPAILSALLLGTFSLFFQQYKSNIDIPYFTKWLTDYSAGNIEYSTWNSLGRLDVLASSQNSRQKLILFNGGQIGTPIYSFDGNYSQLKERALNDPEHDFSRIAVIAAHFLRQNRSSSVLEIGVGAGQEVKAALAFSAKSVTAVEINSYVIDIVNKKYGAYSGYVLQEPRVRVLIDDGRNMIESTTDKFDIIQFFSAYSQTSFLNGRGSLDANYLTTEEAFESYFRHLTPDGFLQINHVNAYKIVRTAFKAWTKLEKSDFRKHIVVVADENYKDIVPTVLIKNSEFKEEEIKELKKLFSKSHNYKYNFELNPFSSDSNPNWALIFENKNAELENYFYDISVSTDDRPFGNNYYNSRFSPKPENLRKLSANELFVFESLRSHMYSMINVIHWWWVYLLALILALLLLRPTHIINLPLSGYFALSGILFIGIQYVLIFQLTRYVDPIYLGSTFIISMHTFLSSLIGYTFAKFRNIRKAYYIQMLALLVAFGLAYLLKNDPYIIYDLGSSQLKVLTVSGIIFIYSFINGGFFVLGLQKNQYLPFPVQVKLWSLSLMASALGGPLILYIFYNFGFYISLQIFIFSVPLIILLFLGSKRSNFKM